MLKLFVFQCLFWAKGIHLEEETVRQRGQQTQTETETEIDTRLKRQRDRDRDTHTIVGRTSSKRRRGV